MQILSSHCDELARLGVRSLALFGSVAREEAGPGSDVDILVEFEGPATFDRYVGLSSYLEEMLGRPVDLVTSASLRSSMRPSVQKDLRYVAGLPAVSG